MTSHIHGRTNTVFFLDIFLGQMHSLFGKVVLYRMQQSCFSLDTNLFKINKTNILRKRLPIELHWPLSQYSGNRSLQHLKQNVIPLQVGFS